MKLGIGLSIDTPGRARPRFSAAGGSATTGLVSLPSWLTITCATTGRTTQTSAATLVAGLGANAARYRNVGSGGGLSVECARTNLLVRSEALETGSWGKSTATVVADQATAPDGNLTADSVVFAAAGSSQVNQNFTFSTGKYNQSAWSRGQSAGQKHSFRMPNVAGSSNTRSGDYSDATTWTRSDFTATVATGGASTATFLNDNANEASSLYVWGMQMEGAGIAYPSSYIPTTTVAVARAADVLTAKPVIAPSGRFNFDFTFAPNYANTEQTSDHNLVYFDANNRIFLQQSTGKIVLRIGGSGHDVLSSALTWSREDAIRVVAVHAASGLSLTVYKNGVIQGTVQTGAAQAAITLPASIGILGDGTTTVECADLRAFAA